MTIGLKLDSRRQRTEASDAAYRDFLENQKGKHGAIFGIKDVFDAWQASEERLIATASKREFSKPAGYMVTWDKFEVEYFQHKSEAYRRLMDLKENGWLIVTSTPLYKIEGDNP